MLTPFKEKKTNAVAINCVPNFIKPTAVNSIMRIAITGTPGTGKSKVAKELGKKLEYKVMNEKKFAQKKGIGKKKGNLLIVPLEELEKELNKELEKKEKIVMEGHLLCEVKLNVDLVVVLRCEEKELEKRLRSEKNSEVKIQDNLFCERENYCGKKALNNYEKNKVLELENTKELKKVVEKIIQRVEK